MVKDEKFDEMIIKFNAEYDEILIAERKHYDEISKLTKKYNLLRLKNVKESNVLSRNTWEFVYYAPGSLVSKLIKNVSVNYDDIVVLSAMKIDTSYWDDRCDVKWKDLERVLHRLGLNEIPYIMEIEKLKMTLVVSNNPTYHVYLLIKKSELTNMAIKYNLTVSNGSIEENITYRQSRVKYKSDKIDEMQKIRVMIESLNMTNKSVG